MYKIGKIPTELTTANTINHVTEPFLADFHNANNFQTADQRRITTKNHSGIPSVVESVAKYPSTLLSPFNSKDN